MTANTFEYTQAFDRNLGWLTEAEQDRLRVARVGIFGCGGTGGFQAQVLARLGVGEFTLVDPDEFELSNLNRQLGASTQTLGKKKVEVIRDMILAINPSAKVSIHLEGLSENNVDSLMEGLGLAIDGVDFFAIEAKLLLFRQGQKRKMPVITSAPVGFGASLIVFGPDSMPADEYFDVRQGMDEKDKGFFMAFGLSPTPLCLKYMRKRSPLDLESGRASSVCPGLMLSGAVTGAEAVKVLTGKGRVHYAPWVYQIDLLTQRVARKYYPMGMRSPWMRLKRALIKKFVMKR